MLRRLVSSTLIVGAVALIAPGVNAQTVDMKFKGTMPSNCTFGTPKEGTLTSQDNSTLSSPVGSNQ
jgi:hypothetical protein